MKLTLWISSNAPDLCPSTSSSTPVVKTAMVAATSAGANSRNGSAGGPFDR